MHTFNRAGGIGYHLVALKYQRTRWIDFRKNLTLWLKEWSPKSDQLLWIGSSAGYTVPKELLLRFKSIQVIEPDPLARWILKYRYPDLPLVFLTEKKIETDPKRVHELFSSSPGSAILFSNVLGQLGTLFPGWIESPQFQDWKNAITQELKDREFLSYHDRLSGKLIPKLPTRELNNFPRALSNQELIDTFYSNIGAKNAVVMDHYTQGLFDEFSGNRTYFSWDLAPGLLHLIEGFKSQNDALSITK